MKKKTLFLGSLAGAGLGLYFLFRNRPEVIRIEEEIIINEDHSVDKVKIEDVFVVASDDLPLSLSIVRPAYRPVKAVIQMVHGILEHRKRYLDLANFLAENGFAVVVSDNRGHGQSIDDHFPLGHMPGVDRMVQDQVEITRFIKKRFNGKPVYLYGHSFGSMLARNYLKTHDQEIDKLLLSGTVYYQKQSEFGSLIAEIACRFAGEHSFSWILKKLSDFDSKDKTWLTNSQEHIEKAKKDRLMIPGYDNRGVSTIWQMNRRMNHHDDYLCQNPELPILSITGAEDLDMTGGEKGLLGVENSLRKVGYHQVDMLNLPNMKHEVINEIDSQLVYQLILDFFNA